MTSFPILEKLPVKYESILGQILWSRSICRKVFLKSMRG